MSSSVVLWSSLWLSAWVYLAFYCFRDYRIDSLRQRLFELRDELFDLAAQGQIEFTHPAYTSTRTLLNSVIRFAHRITVGRTLLAMIFPIQTDSTPRFVSALNELPDGEIKRRIMLIQVRLAAALVYHLVTGFPLLIIGPLLFALHLTIRGAAKKASDILLEFAEHAPGVYQLESLAIEADATQ
jgi:hypothetical protein